MAMFIYTRAATLKIYDDLKKFLFIFSSSMQALYIGYLIYAIAVGAGIIYVNIALLVLSAAYLIFMVTNYIKQKNISKDAVDKVGRAYRWSKICIKAFTLGSTLYGIHIATTRVTATAVILAALTAIAWMLSVLFELVKMVFERYYELIESAITKDLHPYKKIANMIPGVNLESKAIDDEIERKLIGLGDGLKIKIDADKILKKAEKKATRRAKRKEFTDSIIGKVKGILPKKKKQDSAIEATLPAEDKKKSSKK